MSPSQIAKNLIEQIDNKIFAIDVRSAIEKSSGPEEMRFVNITTRSGNVTLTGSVPTWELFFAAQHIVTGVKGVRSVTNALRVAPRTVQLPAGKQHLVLKNALSDRGRRF